MSSSNFVSKQFRAQISNTRKGINHDVYEKRLTKTPNPTPGFTYVPKCIYFYYVRIDNDGKVKVNHYLWPDKPVNQWVSIPHADVPTHMKTMALNARASGQNPPRLGTNNFEPIPWEYRSYIAIFVDELNWKFVRRENDHPSVVFNPDEGESNHTFFDAADCSLMMPNNSTGVDDERWGIYFINHMKGSDGFDLGEDPESFKFNMNFRVEYANTGGDGAYITFDPGGTNQGPPRP